MIGGACECPSKAGKGENSVGEVFLPQLHLGENPSSRLGCDGRLWRARRVACVCVCVHACVRVRDGAVFIQAADGEDYHHTCV